MPKIYPVILCGGSGTRLWPLSRRDFPKQFAVVRDGKSLFERTYERARSYEEADRIVCIGHSDYRFLMKDVLGADSGRNILLLEPVARNTAAAITSAALYLSQIEPGAILACMPADHEIGSTEVFHNSLTEAAKAAATGWITILGVTPTHAATSFGYIKLGDPISATVRAWAVDQFVEKPNETAALQYCREGYRWNSGLVVARADVLIEALTLRVPDIVSACRKALATSTYEFGHVNLSEEAFLGCQSISFDHAVLEHQANVAVVELEAEWSDVGSWTELAKLLPQDSHFNRTAGHVEVRSCKNILAYSPERLTVALGLRDIVVIDTADALLIADRSKLGQLKEIVGDFTAANRIEMISHRRVARPWGWYEVIDHGENYQVKRLTVKPGGVLSLQYHHHRSEHWIVVKGTAAVTCGERRFTLNQNESTYISQGAVHRLENLGTEALELIEVQSGSYLGEDDIVRLSDSYGRVCA